MYAVSGNYLKYSRQTERISHIRGTLSKAGTVLELNEGDFVKDSTALSRKAVSGNNFSIGEVYVDTLSVTLGKSEDKTLEKLTGSELFVEYGIEITEVNSIEWIPLGYFDVPFSGIKSFARKVQITANSRMARLDKSLGLNVTSGTPYEFLVWICNACDVPLGVSQAYVSSLPNGKELIALPAESGCDTYRDVLMWVCSLMACFATIDREGKLIVRPFTETQSLYTVNKDTIASSSYGDDVISIQNVEMKIGDKFYSIVEGVSASNTLSLDENPLLVPTDIEEIRVNRITAIQQELAKLSCKPFKITFNGDPCIDIGDHIKIGDLEDDFLVTSLSLKFRGKSTLEGVSYSNESTKQQSTKRGSSSGGGGGTDNQNAVVRYENVSKISIGEAESSVLFLAFELIASSAPLLSFLGVLDVTNEGTFRLVLTYDGVDLVTVPESHFTVGKHIFAFPMMLNASDVSMAHILRGVMYSVDGGTATIEMSQINASVSAWGIKGGGSGAWDGRLTIQEKVDKIAWGWNKPITFA